MESIKKWYYVLSIREKCLSADRAGDLGRPRSLMHSKRNMNGQNCERNALVPTTKVKDFSVYITSLITTKLMKRNIKVKLKSLLLAMERESCFNIYHQNSVATRWSTQRARSVTENPFTCLNFDNPCVFYNFNACWWYGLTLLSCHIQR